MMKNRNRKFLSPAVSRTISFRLEAEARDQMARRAKRTGVSIHELARSFVLEVLEEGEERAALREAVVSLRTEVATLREDLRLSTEALLTSAGQIGEKEAQVWLEENFKTK